MTEFNFIKFFKEIGKDDVNIVAADAITIATQAKAEILWLCFFVVLDVGLYNAFISIASKYIIIMFTF